jgi:ankyrin repeat protein
VVRYLLDHGARSDLKDDTGRTPADVAEGTSTGRDVARLLKNASIQVR